MTKIHIGAYARSALARLNAQHEKLTSAAERQYWLVYPSTHNLELLYGVASTMLSSAPAQPPVLSELHLDVLMQQLPGCIGATCERSAWTSQEAATRYMDIFYAATGLHCQLESEQE